MQMQPYQQRVIAERDELADKLAKLTKFINSERFTEIEGTQTYHLGNFDYNLKLGHFTAF